MYPTKPSSTGSSPRPPDIIYNIPPSPTFFHSTLQSSTTSTHRIYQLTIGKSKNLTKYHKHINQHSTMASNWRRVLDPLSGCYYLTDSIIWIPEPTPQASAIAPAPAAPPPPSPVPVITPNTVFRLQDGSFIVPQHLMPPPATFVVPAAQQQPQVERDINQPFQGADGKWYLPNPLNSSSAMQFNPGRDFFLPKK